MARKLLSNEFALLYAGLLTLALAGCAGSSEQQSVDTMPASAYQPSPKEIAQQQAAEAAAQAQRQEQAQIEQARELAAQQRINRLTMIIDSALAKDSDSWILSHFVEGSVRDVSVSAGDENDATYTLHGTYSAASGEGTPYDQSVDVKMENGAVACLSYSSDSSSCTPVGGQNQWVKPAVKVGAGFIVEVLMKSAADETHDCKNKALIYGLIETVNEGIVEAGIDALSGTPNGNDPDAAGRLQATKLFVNSLLESDGVRGMTKEALIAYAQTKFPDDRFAAAFSVNTVSNYFSCVNDAAQNGDTP